MPGNEMASGDIYASIEKTVSTKTVLDHTNDILWASGDQLAVFNRSSMSSLYRIREEFAGSRLPASPIISGQIGANINPIRAYPISSAFLDVITMTNKINAADPIYDKSNIFFEDFLITPTRYLDGIIRSQNKDNPNEL